MPFRIYVYYNAADTSRDPDDIHTTELGYKNKEKDAVKLANDFIKNKFFHKDTKLNKTKKGYSATDFCSYGSTIKIEEIQID